MTLFKSLWQNLYVVQITLKLGDIPMFARLGHLAVRRKMLVVIASAILIAIAAGIGSLVFGRLSSAGYSDPGSDSAKVYNYLHDTLGTKDPGVVLILDGGNATVDQISATAAKIESSVRGEPGVQRTLSYWSAGNAPQLKSKDSKAGYLFVYLSTSGLDKTSTIAGELQAKYDKQIDNVRVYATGFSVFAHSVNSRISKDLAKSESFAIPLTFLALAFVFGGLIAASMPLVVGVSAILGSFFLVWLISLTTDVSIFALNLITGLGLGLGIDYSLLIVNRFREELHAGKSVEESVVRTMDTAGRTVFFSGLTVAVTLGSLVLFPQFFLKSFAYAALAVVFVAIAGALTTLPALLAIAGPRIDKYVVRKSAITPKEDGRWASTARLVMKRPVAVVLLVLAVLAILAAPIRGIAFSQVDDRVLPKTDKAAIAAQVQRDRFPGNEANPIEVIIPKASSQSSAISTYVQDLSKISGIIQVVPPTIASDTARIQAISSVSPRTPDGEAQIMAIRAISSPSGTLVGGVAADYTDSQNGIARTLPWVFVWVGVSVLILLFLFTGSIILPIKAVLLNAISLTATLGVLTWIFVDGHLANLLGGFTLVHSLDTSTTVLIAVLTFGLSMDYELFLLSRIKEEHLAGKTTIESVATGLQRSARIISA
ncbi:MAG TPA: MMPL family transporter, partial [Candidatus Nanopelagicaceae bacterium]|nr:MMPL family transporter [Candidatus Nanopelagicaceae bacterium]